MKKYPFLLTLALMLSTAGFGQNNPYNIVDSVKTYFDKGLEVMEENALNRGQVNWLELRQAAYAKAKGAKTYEDVLPVYPFLFEQLNDYHGWLTYKGKTYAWNKKRDQAKNPAVQVELKKKPGVQVRLLKNGIGYILIPGNSDFGMKNVNRNAQAIKDSISKIHPDKVKGWIIDLRLNTGGNMYPMLGGLADIIGDGPAGGFVTAEGQPDEQWSVQGGNFYVNNAQATKATASTSVKPNVPVAVLLSNMTASAGEAVAIALQGRPNTQFIGETTYGLTTANLGFPLNKDSGINLAVLYEADRKGILYKDHIAPQVKIEGGDNFTDWKKDQKVLAALKWLKKSARKKSV
ncbi:S41 family peptidase [Nibribacter koreensis]|uniref:Tail specific protease domain-containing protein n=1 Tax=Nibribacter koreensis TaxID=1084519 RepID=A0ABP8FUR6_9BACT